MQAWSQSKRVDWNEKGYLFRLPFASDSENQMELSDVLDEEHVKCVESDQCLWPWYASPVHLVLHTIDMRERKTEWGQHIINKYMNPNTEGNKIIKEIDMDTTDKTNTRKKKRASYTRKTQRKKGSNECPKATWDKEHRTKKNWIWRERRDIVTGCASGVVNIRELKIILVERRKAIRNILYKRQATKNMRKRNAWIQQYKE